MFLLFNLRHPPDIRLRVIYIYMIYMYHTAVAFYFTCIPRTHIHGTYIPGIDKTVCFCTSVTVSLPAAGLSPRSRQRGTPGGRVYTKAQAWAPSVFRGACSRRSKSRKTGK